MIYCISIIYNYTQAFPIASTNSALERLVVNYIAFYVQSRTPMLPFHKKNQKFFRINLYITLETI